MTTTTEGAALELSARLAAERAVEEARRADEIARRRAETTHARTLRDVDEEARQAEEDRAARQAERAVAADLARLRRRAAAEGERARITAEVARTAEARALRLERMRRTNLWALLPVLVGCGLWSTIGAQHGAARIMGVTPSDALWWGAWLIEPVLIGLVVRVLVVRSGLAAIRGHADGAVRRGAERIAAAALAVSVGLNIVAGLPAQPPEVWTWGAVLAVAGAVLAHLIGPVGAAATAHLIGELDASVAGVDPWAGAPRIADLDWSMSGGQSTPAEVDQDHHADDAAGRARSDLVHTPAVWPVPLPDHAVLLPVVARPPRRALPPSDRPRRITPQVRAARMRRAQSAQTRALVEDYYRAHPDTSVAAAARALGVSESTIKRHRPREGVAG
jgi:hypothetical protein